MISRHVIGGRLLRRPSCKMHARIDTRAPRVDQIAGNHDEIWSRAADPLDQAPVAATQLRIVQVGDMGDSQAVESPRQPIDDELVRCCLNSPVRPGRPCGRRGDTRRAQSKHASRSHTDHPNSPAAYNRQGHSSPPGIIRPLAAPTETARKASSAPTPLPHKPRGAVNAGIPQRIPKRDFSSGKAAKPSAPTSFFLASSNGLNAENPGGIP